MLTYVHLLASPATRPPRLIGWAGKVLADHPDQRRLLVDDPDLIGNAVDELLRFEPPTPHAARYVMEDAEFHGADGAGRQRPDRPRRRGQPRRAALRGPRHLRRPAQARAATSPSASASTTASATRWRASKPGSHSKRCCSGSPSGRSTRPTPQRVTARSPARLGIPPGLRLTWPSRPHRPTVPAETRSSTPPARCSPHRVPGRRSRTSPTRAGSCREACITTSTRRTRSSPRSSSGRGSTWNAWPPRGGPRPWAGRGNCPYAVRNRGALLLATYATPSDVGSEEVGRVPGRDPGRHGGDAARVQRAGSLRPGVDLILLAERICLSMLRVGIGVFRGGSADAGDHMRSAARRARARTC